MKALLNFLRRLFGPETTADEIFAPLNTIVRRAEQYVAQQEAMAEREGEEMRRLQDRIDARKVEIQKTNKRAANVRKLMALAD